MFEVKHRPEVDRLPSLSYGGKIPKIRMDQNTNPLANPVLERWGLPPSLRQYGDPANSELRHAIAEYRAARSDNVVVGNGSDEVLELIFRAYLSEGESVAYWWPSFEMYRFLSILHGGERVEVGLDPPFEADVEPLATAGAKITIVASPNNPTGRRTKPSDLERLADSIDGILVVDGAYAEYSGEDHWKLLGSRPNVVILGTLSKAFGLAGLRVGYGLAHPEIAETLRRVRGPYSVNSVAEAVAVEALHDRKFMIDSVKMARSEVALLGGELSRLGFTVFSSSSNFILCKPPVDAQRLREKLGAEGIAVRGYDGAPLADYVRISVGTPEENTKLLRAVGSILRVK